MCFFFFSSWRCDSTEKLKAVLPRLEQELKDSGKFKDFYQFTFNFAKNPGQKGLGKCEGIPKRHVQYVSNITSSSFRIVQPVSYVDLEMAVAYWNLILTGRFKFLELWNRFLLVREHLAPASCETLINRRWYKTPPHIFWSDWCLFSGF